jgi:phosphatidylethanolamine/phosphatidyl-N-methylethanolamine N-methyltransferase
LKNYSTLVAHWRAWLRNPRAIGSVAPSSAKLALAMVAALPADFSGNIIELGGGTGTITRELLNAVGHERLLVVERDPKLIDGLLSTWPELNTLHADAALLNNDLGASTKAYHAVISGLPLLNMALPVREAIIRACFAVLPDNGVLIQFTYGIHSPVSAVSMARLGLQAERCGRVWNNLPPAQVWRYTRTSTHQVRKTKLITAETSSR